MEKELQFGDMVYGDFPFADGGGKDRWVFVLKDFGTEVAVAYCTTNPTVPGGVRLGALADGKVSNLIARRWELVRKERLQVGKTQRVPMPIPGIGHEVLGAVSRCAKAGVYHKEVATWLLEKMPAFVARAQAQAAKMAARKAAYRK